MIGEPIKMNSGSSHKMNYRFTAITFLNNA